MEFLGVCIVVSASIFCLTAVGLGLVCKYAFDTWIRTTDNWPTREKL